MIKLGNKTVGDNKCYFIAEIGINHNGSLDLAFKLIDEAKKCGADAVKFQKRTPEICVPEHQKNIKRDTPWGNMTYFDYKKKIEFEGEEYLKIDEYCKKNKIDWFASPWDIPSVEFLSKFDPICYKVASASLTDKGILSSIKSKNKPIILSTGMSTDDEISNAVDLLSDSELLIAHSTSSYPCLPEELNLNMIKTLKEKYPNYPIGYSGHEKGIQTSVAAYVLGAKHIERHFTLDRTMWGTDHSASLEPKGFKTLVRDVRLIEKALGDGKKKVYDSEISIRKKLRGT
tara:strand:- start:1011 stop:1871 length:861 start_codon:yes stop_codon:yes gene_type:complete